MKIIGWMVLGVVMMLAAEAMGQTKEAVLRPPAVPLVAVDPYFSIWSAADKLTDADAKGNPTIVHWTGAANQLTSLVRVDGKVFRIMGTEPRGVAAMEQKGVKIMPTTVTYTFEGAGVRVGLSFMTPLLPEDLLVFSRPVTYLNWEVTATDGQFHDVQVYYDNTAELAVNNPKTEKVAWSAERFGNVAALKVGTVEQAVLKLKGDRVRINWGYAYTAVPDSEHGKTFIAEAEAARRDWEKATPAGSTPVEAARAPVLAASFDLGQVGSVAASRYLMLAYDDVVAAQYFGKNLKAYWKKDGDGIGELLKESATTYETLQVRCARFDKELMADLTQAGGAKYAWVGALAYRQSFAASKVVADGNGLPLYFCKENTSNGCMGTVDVFYPQAPLPLLMSPSLAKAMLVPVLEYASSSRWTFASAPHDVGTWPQANGQAYGGSKSDGGMPVEETGNMLLLVAAVAEAEGNADFAGKYWPTLTKWAEYLQKYGRDPDNQLCTDDFAGRLAHNANLAGKTVCALGAYGKLATMRGDKATGEKYTKMAKEFAAGWIKQADDGDHFRLAFDKPDTWSSKYNLVWDKILGLDLFPEEAIKKEMVFYRKNIDTYGLPLDGRKHGAGRGANQRQAWWSKTDWAFWTASLTNDPQDFAAITEPAYRYFDETTVRVGLSDLYFTDKPDTADFFARPVIGGVFIKMLYDKAVWRKWALRDVTKASGPWAALPALPKVTEVVKAGTTMWRYTTENPGEGWSGAGFDDGAWKQGKGGFGTKGTPGVVVNTVWNSADIWLRGEMVIPEGTYHDLQLSLFHDEDVEIYMDGKKVAAAGGFNTEYELQALKGGLSAGKHLFAVHCHQTMGGQGVDLGVVDVGAGK